ncbi:MAG: hypothetical protein ABJD97_16675, partial [Betaproteobacteria bacterium]
VFDDPGHYECHAGTIKASVTLRAQLVRGAVDTPVVAPPAAPVPLPPLPPAPGATFQPVPPAPTPN